MSLPWFTVVVGLVDGLNPCAFYVLVVLLGILLQVRSRARVALFGATFVLMSGLVYFLFMTVWLNAFVLVGDTRWITRALAQREDLGAAARYAYLALYNVAYVVPLAGIVTAYALTLRRFAMTEARARALKTVSGLVLVAFGLVFLLAPHLLKA